MASSSSHCVYDVFTSFSGEDALKNFINHFLKELDQKSITAFKVDDIKSSKAQYSEFKQAIKDSRIAVVVFSENYTSSGWCLNQLLEILNCKEKFGQMVIPVFYGLEPSNVRKQTGVFGDIFEETCRHYKTEEVVKNQWREALNSIANIPGYSSGNWDNEAALIDDIANNVFGKLNLTTFKDFEEFVGIEDHIAGMGSLLFLESEKVRMLGIWGPSGVGKTTISRSLFGRLSRQFQHSIFIDRAFLSKGMENVSGANTHDYKTKLRLQTLFLSEILGKKDVKINHLGAVKERLQHLRVLIFIDGLDDQLVLDALAGQTQWFGSGSRIIVVTNDKHILRAHGIDQIYEVSLPSDELALKMLCRSAFRQNFPPEGFEKLAVEVVLSAGRLPLGLNLFGSYLRDMDKESWVEMMPKLQYGLDEKIGKTLRVNYDALNNKKDEALFRYIACLFNGEKVDDIKLLLADSDLDVDIGIKYLTDMSLVQLREGTAEMHRLLQEMGKEIVHAQSKKPGEREFLVESKEICHVLGNTTGTRKVLGIALDLDEIDELHIHEDAFKRMRNILFLKLYSKKWNQMKEVRWHLPEDFNYFPRKLRLLRLDGYPMSCLPSNFRPENLVKLRMRESKLERLWEGHLQLKRLKIMDLRGSRNLKEIPDLSMAFNLETLRLNNCSSLVELPSSIQYLNKLTKLDMSFCKYLEILPTGINLQSLCRLNLRGCSRLKSFPNISTNISNFDISQTAIEEIPSTSRLEKLVDLCMEEMMSDKLWERVQPLTPLMAMLCPSLTRLSLSVIPNLVELPSSFQDLNKLKWLSIKNCINLETLPTKINLKSLDILNLSGCSQLSVFPDISTNISSLYLSKRGIVEVPWWIHNFSKLRHLCLTECKNLQRVSINVFKLNHLETADFSDCRALTEVSWNDSPSELLVAADNIHSELPLEESSSLPDDYFSKVKLIFINCFNLKQEVLLEQQLVCFKSMEFSGEEVPTYFTHRSTGTSLTSIPLHTSTSQPFFKFRACVVVDSKSISESYGSFNIKVCYRFIDKVGNYFDSADWQMYFSTSMGHSHQVIFDCCFPPSEDDAPLAELDYYQGDIQFHLTSEYSQLELKGCGIQLLDDGLNFTSL